LRTPRHQHPHWYELFNGPKSIRQLAAALNHQGSYEILYGVWSATGHGTDVVKRNLVVSSSGGPAARAIRSPLLISSVVNMAVNFYLDAARSMIRRYRPGEERRYAEWYAREVRSLWFAVDGIEAPRWPPSQAG
jgi:hypothetical protein